MLEKKLAWEPWDEDSLEQEIVENFYEVNESMDEEDEGLVNDALLFLDRIPSLVTTPMGMYQLHDKMSVINQFDCWTGHTNFNITTSVQEAIEKVDGVELLSIQSRYRFFLGVGKLFSFSDVRVDIEKAICGNALDEETQETVNMIREDISVDKYWTIFVAKNGEISYTSTNDEDDEDYLETVIFYEKRRNNNGGLIFQNE